MKKIKKFEIFIVVVLILKIVVMGFFSSDYQNGLFMKFIYGFINEIRNRGFSNPYSIFKNEVNLFPYPPTMFLIELVGGIISIGAKSIFIKNILFKLPSLIFDLLGLYFLVKMFPDRRKYIGVLYFASPIIFYATYMHGQLDIIPTVFLLGSLYFLINKRNNMIFSIMLALALSSKLHILAIIPLLYLYIYKKDGFIEATKSIGISFLLTILIILPFFDTKNNFMKMVIMNKEQRGVTSIFLQYQNNRIYLSILAIICIYLKAFSLKKINKNLLYSFCGVLFSIFLILVLPMPGWYIWIVPFITIFFVNVSMDKYVNIYIYLFLNILYGIYFIFAHKTIYTDLYFINYNLNFLKVSNAMFVNITFTMLTAVLTYTSYMMYQLGIAESLFYRRKNKSFSIGISGDSGAGKSTLIEMIKNIFGEKNILFLEGDGDHKWERGDEMWKQLTALNPKANYIHKQADDLNNLRRSQNVFRVEYDHDTGKFTESSKVKSKPYIVLCGLHALYLPKMRKNLDLKIYMDVDEKLRRYWKIQRDVYHRGYSKEKVIESIEQRMPDAIKYIYPQKQYADILIKYFDKTLTDYTIENHDIKLDLEITLNADVDLDNFIFELRQEDIIVNHDYKEDLTKQVVVFSGESLSKKRINFSDIAERIIPNLDEILNKDLSYINNLNGIIEMIILISISHKMREEGAN